MTNKLRNIEEPPDRVASILNSNMHCVDGFGADVAHRWLFSTPCSAQSAKQLSIKPSNPI